MSRPPDRQRRTRLVPRLGPPLGAHMSIAGGYHHAIESAVAAGCTAVQLFTKNNNQWRAKEITDAEVQLFRDALAQSAIRSAFAHDSYLINLASPHATLWKKSLDAFVIEILRCERLGLEYLVAHPGSYVSSTEQRGLARVARALDEAHRQTRGVGVQVLLEITAGQGTNLGHRFEHLAAILDRVRDPDRLGVCFDTCHAFAAGYAMATESEYTATMSELDRVVGIDRVKAFHLNDSKRERGSRIDRHEHIGRGRMGLAPFRHLLNDSRFRDVPMCLETPKGAKRGKNWDVINLRTLRGLITA